MTNAEMRNLLLIPMRERVTSCCHEELRSDLDVAAARARAGAFARRPDPHPPRFYLEEEIRRCEAVRERALRDLADAQEILAYAERYLPE